MPFDQLHRRESSRLIRKRGRLAARGGVNNSGECGYVQIGPDPVSKNHTL
jgi:hypothetical protein